MNIVIAEDVLQQTYYLGHVDYWLVSQHVASSFVTNVNGVLKDFSTVTFDRSRLLTAMWMPALRHRGAGC